jgi:hypothetical protein
MRERELTYVEISPLQPLIRALRTLDTCTIRYHVDSGWLLWIRVADARGGESLFSIPIDPHASEATWARTIKYVEKDDWLVWPPVEFNAIEAVIIVVKMPRNPPWTVNYADCW